ncbi:lamin tail domain-containing protein [Phycisphaeraceae bacterium D3-23]
MRHPNQIEPLEPRLLFTAVPLITEFLASNSDGLQDEDGDRSDWIELFNAGDSALDLTGWYLTDDAGNLDQWSFPSITLAPDELLIVFASGKSRADADGTELHTNFKLSSDGEYLALVEDDGATVAHAYAPQFPEQFADRSYGLAMTANDVVLVAEGSTARHHIPTGSINGWNTAGFNDSGWTSGATGIGYENSPGDNPNYAALIESTLPSGTTSFYMRQTFNVADTSAFSSLMLRMRYDDGFVAYLNGELIAADNAPGSPVYNSLATAQLGDFLSVDFQPFDISEHLDKLIVGTNVLAIQGLNLINSSDYLIEPELIAGVAQVVTPHEVGFFTSPTPGTVNGQSFEGIVADTQFSVDRGFYDSPISVAITTATPGASIVYTLDGSAPAVTTGGVITNGTLYTNPLNITGTETVRAMGYMAGFESTNIDTHTYIFPADVIDQDAAFTLAQGFPPAWGGTSPDYGVDASDVNNADFISALTAIPTISINIDADDLFANDGIYTNSTAHGSAWERAASIELINPDGSVGFQENAGLRIQGGAFRNHSLSKKHSFRIVFRGEYGVGELHYPLFGADAVDEFDTITLRMDSNDGWSWDSAGSRPQYARDEFGRQTQLALGQPSSHGARAHLYLNGVYWGLYNPVERPDANFSASYYGGDPDNWDVINTGSATDGNTNSWNTLVGLAQNVANAGSEAQRTTAYYHLQGANQDGSNNPAVENYLDVDNYIDYLITNFYGGNADWPHNNYYMGRERGLDSTGFKFHMWDAEWSLGLNASVNSDRTGVSAGPAEPYSDLRASAEFRLAFADRVHRAFFNDGPLTTANAIERYQGILDTIDSAINAEVGRWGDQHNGAGYDRNDWLGESNSVINGWLTQRANIFVNQLRNAGLYSTIAAVVWNQRGGTIDDGFGIALGASVGNIYYTLDGSDPRAIGGGLSANAIQYTGTPINLTDHATVTARVRHLGTWSAIDQADFVLADTPADATNLRVTELHYNPQGPTAAELAAGFTDGDAFEFIELLNTSAVTISLHGVQLKRTIVDGQRDGVAFTFGLTALAPGERIVVVSDLAAFTQRYGTGINTAGQYAGNLANGGETLRLTDADNNTIQQFAYDDAVSWPATPDGDGPSLVVINHEGNYNSGNNWEASTTTNGTPGEDEATAIPGDITGDGFVGAEDLDALLALWGDAAASSPQASNADLDGNGTVGSGDLSIVIANFGNATPPATPTSNGQSPTDNDNDNTAPGSNNAGNNNNNNNNNAPTRPTYTRPAAADTPTSPTPTAPIPPTRRSDTGLTSAQQQVGATQSNADALALSRPVTRPEARDASLTAATAKPKPRFDALALRSDAQTRSGGSGLRTHQPKTR